MNFFKKSLAALVAVSFSFAAEGDPYEWPSYPSDLDFNTKEHLGEIDLPTKFSTDCDGVTGQKAGKWWAFYWGKDRDSRITDETIDSLLKKYDEDFSYLIDSMGWAPDRRAQGGYYSAVYYYGSGTCAGGAVTDTTGGWQTNVGSNYYEAVSASFYPIYSFNPSCPYGDRVAQMNAMVHEGIHSMTKAYPGAQNAHWFQEGGNTWIQQEMESKRSGVYKGMGFLNAAALIAPFIPIESYSGWLLDGSFGGPGAEGVEVRNGSEQLCNWRNLLGGYQYGNLFPTFLGEWVGKGAVRWLYGNANRYILEAFGSEEGLGSEKTKQLIMEYRAKSALLDYKKWSNELKSLLNGNFGSIAKAEWSPAAAEVESWTMTPYTVTTDSSGYLIPENRTTPGWSGANIIPLEVSSGSNLVKLSFLPLGENMSLQICYRSTDGTPVYSVPVEGEGSTSLRLDKEPQDGVVFAVICNLDYNYTDEIRLNHYDYRIKLESGISKAGNVMTKYYNNFVTEYDWPELENNSDVPVDSSSQSNSNEGSSDSVTVSQDTLKIDVSVSLPIDDNFAGIEFDLLSSEVAQFLSLSESQIASSVSYFGISADGVWDSVSTANAPGHWFDKNGFMVSYGENAFIYSELNLSTMKGLLGHYPNRVSDKETYSLKQGLKYGKKVVLYSISIVITNDESNAEAESTGLRYGLAEGLPTHIWARAKGGVIYLHYSLNSTDDVKISLYSAYGALLTVVSLDSKRAGDYTKEIDIEALGLARGTYILKVTTGAYREAISMTLGK